LSTISAPIETLPDPVALDRSREYCKRLTHAQAKNFYYGLKFLPEPKRSSMFALYSYMRAVDDIVDAEDDRPASRRAAELEEWRLQTHAALRGAALDHGTHPLWPAFADMARAHGLPSHIFDEVIAGQQQDLEPAPFQSFKDLHLYCYRVAGVVGLASIRVWGFQGGDRADRLAVKRGLAFQLTNILRDLCEDADHGRVYLPRDELAAAGVSGDDLRARRGGPAFVAMMQGQIERARSFYERSAGLDALIDADSRPTLAAMTAIYSGILDRIAADPERVLRQRVSLSLVSKLRIGWQAARSR
jgi:phytoene synthase